MRKSGPALQLRQIPVLLDKLVNGVNPATEYDDSKNMNYQH